MDSIIETLWVGNPLHLDSFKLIEKKLEREKMIKESINNNSISKCLLAMTVPLKTRPNSIVVLLPA